MIIVALDTFVAIMAGLIIFPVCFSFGISPDSGPTLLFESLLNVFCVMEYGRVIGTIFFVFMFFAAFTTVIAVIESIIALTMEHFNTTRRFAVFLNFVIILLSSIPCVLGFNVWQDVQPLGAGSSILDFEDFIVSNNILPFGALFFVIFAVFGWGLKNCFDEINTGTGIKLSNKFKYYFMAILPLVIGVILVYGYINKFS
jgi:NSS family neurotransmitter:Na+ symporter